MVVLCLIREPGHVTRRCYIGCSLSDLIDGILQKQVHTVYVDRGEVFRQVRCFQVRQYRESLRSYDPAACRMSRVFSFRMYMSSAAFRYFRRGAVSIVRCRLTAERHDLAAVAGKSSNAQSPFPPAAGCQLLAIFECQCLGPLC